MVENNGAAAQNNKMLEAGSTEGIKKKSLDLLLKLALQCRQIKLFSLANVLSTTNSHKALEHGQVATAYLSPACRTI